MSVPKKLPLRPYQREAVEAFSRAWSGARRPSGAGPVNRAAAVLPTGGGKTVVFADLLAHAHRGGRRGLVLVHREELAEQARSKIHNAAPHASIGIVKAARNEVDTDIIVASVQTLQDPRRRDQIQGVGLGIADECHHAASPSWMATLAHFGAWRGVPWAGFTATLATDNTRRGVPGLGDVWPEVVYRRDIQDMIREGWLVPARGIRVQVESLDLAAVKASRGDFQVADLGDALMDAGAPNTAALAVLEHAKDRHTAAFWPTVATAEAFVQECVELGLTAELITGTTPTADRHAAYERFRTGETSILSTAMVLTEGWDAPWCDTILIGRPTHSRTLYTQMVGRGLRKWDPAGKTECLVMDLTGASERHALATLVDLRTAEPEDGEPPKVESTTDPDPELVGAMPEEIAYITGKLRARSVDLFAESRSVWLKTADRGWWFVPTARNIYFLYPQAGQNEGLYAVGRKAVRTNALTRLEVGLSLEYAMAWAEKYAADDDAEFGMNISGRKASWRKGNTPATDGQKRVARTYGVEESLIDNASKRDLADLISVAMATRRLRNVT